MPCSIFATSLTVSGFMDGLSASFQTSETIP
jgi:hypothetical protein